MIFSIIVPYFKESARVRAECVESIRVAIDKYGNQDDVEILEDYGADGVSAARNRCIAKAKGEWILFVDADDIVKSNWLVAVNSAIVENDSADIIAFGDIDDVALYRGLWNKAYRRSVLPLGGFGPYAHGEDRLFLLKAILKANHIVKLPMQLYVYRPSAQSATSKPRDLGWIEDTLGYSAEMITVMNGHELPPQLYHDIVVWTLEECAWTMQSLSDVEKKLALKQWHSFLPLIMQCRYMSIWHRLVAFACLRFGVIARFTLCVCTRSLKRLIAGIGVGVQ